MVRGKDPDESFSKYVKKSRVFILGAGFSADAGIPLTAPLLELAMRKFSVECPGLYERVNEYARESVEQYDRGDIDYSRINFSDLCTFLEYIELREYGGGERWKAEGSREKLALKFYLAKTIAECTPTPDKIPQMYLDFVNQLHKRDIVISFNWDLLLEVALQRVGKTYTYNWGEDDAIKLFKMHGSINWRLNEPETLNGPVDTLGWESLRFMEGIMDVEIYHTPSLLNYGNWHHRVPLGEVEPFLVLPGNGKAFDARSNAGLWYKPEGFFAATHDVYIIGLSLAPDDFFIRSFFLSNLPFIDSYSGVRGRETYVINPDPGAATNYNFVLSRGLAELIPERFSAAHINWIKERLDSI